MGMGNLDMLVEMQLRDFSVFWALFQRFHCGE